MLEIRKYFDSFTPPVIAGVRQALEHFKCCEHVYDVLVEMQKEGLEAARYYSEAIAKRKKRVARRRRKPRRPQIPERLPTDPLGSCPKCDGWLFGLRLPGCEQKITGRAYYKECNQCSYYSEIFLKGENYIEIEGG